jgi:hypothetical protein
MPVDWKTRISVTCERGNRKRGTGRIGTEKLRDSYTNKVAMREWRNRNQGFKFQCRWKWALNKVTSWQRN